MRAPAEYYVFSESPAIRTQYLSPSCRQLVGRNRTPTSARAASLAVLTALALAVWTGLFSFWAALGASFEISHIASLQMITSPPCEPRIRPWGK